jgi:serine/threonine-protein kinase
MADHPTNFWQELKRRRVVRVIIIYAAAAYVILELVSIIAEPFGLPEWTLKLVFVLLCIGLVVSIILSWIYDITPKGVQKTKPIKEGIKDEIPAKSTSILGWKIITYASAVIIIGLILFNVLTRKKSVDLAGLEKTIAILPFEAYGNTDSSNFLHDVIPIALIGELKNVEGFIVRPRGSSLKYKNTSLRSPEIGNELNANYLVTGYVQQQSDNVLVSIMLEKARTEEVIWEDSFKMVADDIFKVQEDIAMKVASSLKNNFLPPEENPTDSTQAWLSYLTGLNYYWSNEQMIDFELAIRYFERAVQIDPQFSLAYAKLSSAHCIMYHYHYDRSEKRLLRARKTLERANEVDPENPDVILAEGIYSYVTNDYENALEKYNAAEKMTSGNSELYLMIGSLYRRKGNLEKTIEYYIKSYEIDPQNRTIALELGETYLMLRKYDESEKYFDIYTSLGGNYDNRYVSKFHLYLMSGKGMDKSRQVLMEARALSGKIADMQLTDNQIRIELMDGKYEDALAVLDSEGTDTLDNQFHYKFRSLYCGEIYWLQGNMEWANRYFDSARIHLASKIDDSPLDPRYHSALGIAYAGLGRKEEAIESGLTALRLMPVEKDYYKAIFRLEDMARIYTMVGEYQLALDQLDQLLSMPSLMSVHLLRKDPIWEPLRDLPDFQNLMENHGDN